MFSKRNSHVSFRDGLLTIPFRVLRKFRGGVGSDYFPSSDSYNILKVESRYDDEEGTAFGTPLKPRKDFEEAQRTKTEERRAADAEKKARKAAQKEARKEVEKWVEKEAEVLVNNGSRWRATCVFLSAILPVLVLIAWLCMR